MRVCHAHTSCACQQCTRHLCIASCAFSVHRPVVHVFHALYVHVLGTCQLGAHSASSCACDRAMLTMHMASMRSLLCILCAQAGCAYMPCTLHVLGACQLDAHRASSRACYRAMPAMRVPSVHSLLCILCAQAGCAYMPCSMHTLGTCQLGAHRASSCACDRAMPAILTSSMRGLWCILCAPWLCISVAPSTHVLECMHMQARCTSSAPSCARIRTMPAECIAMLSDYTCPRGMVAGCMAVPSTHALGAC